MFVIEKGANNAESCKKISEKDSPKISTGIKKQLKKDKYAGKADTKEVLSSNLRVPGMPLQRQGTFTRTNYPYRKSISQIDMKLARRNGLLCSTPIKKREQNNASSNGECHGDLQLAGMRVYLTFMKNAWRKRRGEAKTFENLVMDLRKDNVIMKNQLHLFKSLFYAEKSTTDEISQQLRISIDQIHDLERTQELLRAEIVQCEKNRTNAEEQLMIKTKDYNALNVFFKQTKIELFGVMSDIHDIRSELDSEEAKVQQLESEKLQLIENFEIFHKHTKDDEEHTRRVLIMKDGEILSLENRTKNLEIELKDLKEFLCCQISDLSATELKLKRELEEAQSELKVLRHCLAATIGQRIQKCWKNAFLVQRATFHVVHWFAFGLMPAMPAPLVSNPFPFTLTLEKAMSIMKR